MLHGTMLLYIYQDYTKLPDQMTPKQYHTGVTPDISPWLQFTFWQPILFLDIMRIAGLLPRKGLDIGWE
jgi:hypothetical protein